MYGTTRGKYEEKMPHILVYLYGSLLCACVSYAVHSNTVLPGGKYNPTRGNARYYLGENLALAGGENGTCRGKICA